LPRLDPATQRPTSRRPETPLASRAPRSRQPAAALGLLALLTLLTAALSPAAALANDPPRPQAPLQPPSLSPPPAEPAAHAAPADLTLERSERLLPAGYSRLLIEVRPGLLASIAIFGPREALSHFEIEGAVAHDPLGEDGMLPRVASFLVPEGTTQITLSIELREEALLARVLVAPSRTLPGADDEPPLIGMPSPARRDDGYLLERPGRYQFARPDVASALVDAFRDTRRRFRRDPISIADISQWDGRRPALDVGKPRHTSHEGGRDVDIGLPSTLEPSTLRDHCDKVVSADFSKGWCRAGTAHDLDALRLAFLLGRLVNTRTVDKIFIDQEFIAPLAEAARRLHNPKSFPSWVVDRLQPEARVVRHVGWHTDHVHVRFLGVKGKAPFEEK
jgi:hypothetical protein